MGSLPNEKVLPDFADTSLVLTHPTEAEKQQTWRLNHGEWGGPLSLKAYMQREPFLASTALTSQGGIMHWILTETTAQNEPRKILASCETIRKRVLYVHALDKGTETEVKEGISYGIGSVYTYPEFRGKKYAARMLKDLSETLKTWPEQQYQENQSPSNGVKLSNGDTILENGAPEAQQTNGQTKKEVICTALWSDIGKKFYASKGWPVFESSHVEFPSSFPFAPGITSIFDQAAKIPHTSLTLTPVTNSNLASLCSEDETQLRAQMKENSQTTGRASFAFRPDADVFRWHWAREDFLTPHVFPGCTPSEVRGMIATVTTNSSSSQVSTDGSSPQTQNPLNGDAKAQETRVWAIWARNYGSDAATKSENNTLYILRFVIMRPRGSTEPDSKALQLAFNAILHSALDTARTWHCGKVNLWNPSSQVKALAAGSGVKHHFVDREMESISSMMWYGPEKESDVDWFANEKFCWC
ncbi:hypothetical protein F5Y18DRAFT_36571 [Xylariaceae sp. FL1019]|nr:hypothetical protein F5Y18DRAFT_36571 [Xylariaceae sp. FL1019]